jgi:hypothetical protein
MIQINNQSKFKNPNPKLKSKIQIQKSQKPKTQQNVLKKKKTMFKKCLKNV